MTPGGRRPPQPDQDRESQGPDAGRPGQSADHRRSGRPGGHGRTFPQAGLPRRPRRLRLRLFPGSPPLRGAVFSRERKRPPKSGERPCPAFPRTHLLVAQRDGVDAGPGRGRPDGRPGRLRSRAPPRRPSSRPRTSCAAISKRLPAWGNLPAGWACPGPVARRAPTALPEAAVFYIEIKISPWQKFRVAPRYPVFPCLALVMAFGKGVASTRQSAAATSISRKANVQAESRLGQAVYFPKSSAGSPSCSKKASGSR